MDEARRRARARHCRPVRSEGREKKKVMPPAAPSSSVPPDSPPSSLPPILLHVMDELIYWHMYVIEFLAVCLGLAGRSR